MAINEPILDVRDLVTEIRGRRGPVRVVDEVSLTIGPGEIVGLVGESGSGKSMTAFSILGLFPTPAARSASGEILFRGQDLRRPSAPGLRPPLRVGPAGVPRRADRDGLPGPLQLPRSADAGRPAGRRDAAVARPA